VGRADPGAARAQLLPYLDLAYQGYGDGIEKDAYAVRALADAGLTFFVANSFSKSMSVYGERCGALSVVLPRARRGRAGAGPAEGHRAPQLLQPAASTPARSSPMRAGRRRAARRVGGRGWPRCASASCRDAPRLHGVLSAKAAGARLRLLPDPARHVQLHRPERRAGGSSECKTATSGCKGQNSCKGQGWVTKKSADECTKAGGKVVDGK
jgi:hypothetical protein